MYQCNESTNLQGVSLLFIVVSTNLQGVSLLFIVVSTNLQGVSSSTDVSTIYQVCHYLGMCTIIYMANCATPVIQVYCFMCITCVEIQVYYMCSRYMLYTCNTCGIYTCITCVIYLKHCMYYSCVIIHVWHIW